MFKTSIILEPRSKSADHTYIPTATHEAVSAKCLHLLKTPKLLNTKMVASIHIYSNTKMVALISEADELKMFAWDNEDAWAITLIHTASAKQHVPGARGQDRGMDTARVAKSPSRESLVSAESPSLELRLRDSARLGQSR
jgi:hypothetical protein